MFTSGCSEEGKPLEEIGVDARGRHASDIPTFSGVDSTRGPGTGIFGEVCDEHTDCASGICMESEEGPRCSTACTDGCPEGWDCKKVFLPHTVEDFVCVPAFARLCRPCSQDEDCHTPYVVGISDGCVDQGDAGSFCGASCAAQPCPDGYDCINSLLTNGNSALQCVPKDGEICTCKPGWNELGLLTECRITNELGSCDGLRTCGLGGMTPCDAPTPSAELCNAADDDCDGITDEDVCAGMAPPEPEPVAELNEDWIGGPCTSNADCDYDQGFCLTETEGFPNGMCSKPCDLYCPDQDGKTTTFCIDETAVGIQSSEGMCTMRCNFDASDTGCRDGYQCVALTRHNDPGTSLPACIPISEGAPPPSTYMNEGWIGGLCSSDNDCGYQNGFA